jgi:hypothetical protein
LFNFKFTPLRKKENYIRHFENNACILRFSYVQGGINGAIASKLNPDVFYDVFDLHSTFFPDQNPEDRFTSIIPGDKYTLQLIREILLQKFSNILKGDISWIPRYNELREIDSKIGRFIINHFNKAHPIWRKMYLLYDKSWRDDLRKYLEENNIKLGIVL